MKVFTCSNFKGHNPVGVAAVVVAKDEAAARLQLDIQLRAAGLPGMEAECGLTQVRTDRRSVEILCDGNY